ncbi:MAG: cysteine-rich CWC family protein [Mariprofundus sp.]
MAHSTKTDIDPCTCPLCGRANHCAVAENSGQLTEPCWCMRVQIPSALRDQIPPQAKQRACICSNCLQLHEK